MRCVVEICFLIYLIFINIYIFFFSLFSFVRQSWIRVLQPSFEDIDEDMGQVNKKKVNTCPFTGQKLSRRDLIKLDKTNLEKYRSKIINFK